MPARHAGLVNTAKSRTMRPGPASAKVGDTGRSQPPVNGMATAARSGPAGDPDRSSIVPPSPPEAARTVIEPMFFRDTVPRPIQSPSSISMARRPPESPERLPADAPPCAPPVAVNHSASQKAARSVIEAEPVRAGAPGAPPSSYRALTSNPTSRAVSRPVTSAPVQAGWPPSGRRAKTRPSGDFTTSRAQSTPPALLASSGSATPTVSERVPPGSNTA
ncbi:hypothetical protein LNW71_00330 [Streptomyces sp. RKAG290]|nr:hypothetical protein [Streptomyces sp. RKAG290]MCM2410330.1 hypothetical protein [Streptomyces sp. RKAG290]